MKALFVPITHDEVASALYFPSLSFWDIVTLSNGDQNNHILNTLLTKWSVALFGAQLWAVRLPSVLSFVVYLFASRKILQLIVGEDSKFYIPAAVLFVLSPYVIDFFCLSRGYGMCLAFIALSCASIIQGYSFKKISAVYLSLVWALFAVLASFSSISFLCAISLLSFTYIVLFLGNKWRHYMLLTCLMIAIAIILYLPLAKISGAHQFAGWTNNGFFQDTLMSIVRMSLYGSKIFLTTLFISYFFILIIVSGCIYIFYHSLKNKELIFLNNAVALGIVLLTIGINILQGWIMHLPNLNGRIALFFYPLIVIALLACKPIFIKLNNKIKIGIVGIICVFGIHHIVHLTSYNSVLEWKYDSHTLQVLQAISEPANPGNVALETNWIYQPSLSFHSKEHKYSKIEIGNYSKALNPLSEADYYYCKAEDYKILAKNFNVFVKFDDNWLLKHK